MNLRINHHYIYIVVIAFFFFFWGITLNHFNDVFELVDQPLSELTSLIFKKFKFSYLILILLIPIFYNLIKKKKFSSKRNI